MRELELVRARISLELLVERGHEVFSQNGVSTELIVGLKVVLKVSTAVPRLQVFILVPLHQLVHVIT